MNGNMCDGPMYYLANGLKLKWLGALFTVFATVAVFGIGNMVQSNSVADVVRYSFNFPVEITGIILAVATGLVLLWGIKCIGKVTGVLVPFMVVFYFLAALIVVIVHVDQIPDVIKLDLVWTLADIMNGLMALPNLVALIGLSSVVAIDTKNYFRNKKWPW